MAIQAAFTRVWNDKDLQNDRLGQGAQKDERAWWERIVAAVFASFPPFADFGAFFEDLYVSFGKETRWRLYDEARGVLEALASRCPWHLQLGLPAHGTPRTIGDAGYFRSVVISAVVGSSKPSASSDHANMSVEPAT
jgi:hypothetical protein